MTKSYLDLKAQIEKLQAEAEALREQEIADVVGRIKEAIRHYGLTAQDLGLRAARAPYGSKKSGASRVTAASAKFSDGQGNTWGGRGPRPAWIKEALAQGRSLEEFADGTQATKTTAARASRKAGAKSSGRGKAPSSGSRGAGTSRGGRRSKRQPEAVAQRSEEHSGSGSEPVA